MDPSHRRYKLDTKCYTGISHINKENELKIILSIDEAISIWYKILYARVKLSILNISY